MLRNFSRRIFVTSLLILFIGANMLPTYAQEETPAQRGVIGDYLTFLFFPAGIRFDATLAIPRDELAGGTLSLFQASGYEASFPLDLENDIGGQDIDLTGLAKWVLFDEDLAPNPFEPISYRWEIITTDDFVSQVTDEILFQHDLEWRNEGDPPLGFYSSNPALGINSLGFELEPVFDLLQAQTQSPLEFQFVIYESDFEFCERVELDGEMVARIGGNIDLPCTKEIFTEYFNQKGFTLIHREDTNFQTLQNQLIDSMVDAAYQSLLIGRNDIPAWFWAGLRQLVRPQGNFPAIGDVRLAETQDSLLSLSELGTRPPADSDDESLWGAQSYLLTLYLADIYGAESPFELAEALQEADFETAFGELTGSSLDIFYREWEVWLSTQNAEVAAVWNPYLETTPTPTPTQTATDIPPSRTPTLTRTPTVPPTERTATPLPTFTDAPTLTLTPDSTAATATRTPLPAGAFATQDALATQAAQPASDSGGGGGNGCFSAFIVMPIGALVILNRRRRSQTA